MTQSGIIQEEPEIMRSEVEEVIRKLKIYKAPGIDGITGEILKEMGDEAIATLHKICNEIWKTGLWLKDWLTSIIIPLHKKGSTRKCNNYRTISLLSHPSKVMLHIINTGLQYNLSDQTPREQAGFIKGRGTREQIVNIREKCNEYNVAMIMCFIDYSKAFDLVNWNKIGQVLQEMDVPDHLIKLVKTLYLRSFAVVEIEDATIKEFFQQRGVRQG